MATGEATGAAGAVVVVPPVVSGGLPTQPLRTTAPAAETAAVVKNFRLEKFDIESSYLLAKASMCAELWVKESLAKLSL
jgi:hypothetical protein